MTFLPRAPGHFFGRQTATIHRDAVALLQPASAHAAADEQSNAVLHRLDFLHGSRFFNDSCEHVCLATGAARVSKRFATLARPSSNRLLTSAALLVCTRASKNKSSPNLCHSTSSKTILSCKLQNAVAADRTRRFASADDDRRIKESNAMRKTI